MDVLMPQLGETVAEGKITVWFKKVGDPVEAGQNLFEIETDKVSVEVQAIASGTLAEIRVGTGEIAPVGAVVAVIGGAAARPVAPERKSRENGNPAAALNPFRELNTPERNFGPARTPKGTRITPVARRLAVANGIDIATVEAAIRASNRDVIRRADIENCLAQPGRQSTTVDEDAEQRDTAPISPAVRRMLTEHNLDPALIPPSGKGGRLTKEDVQAFIDAGSGKAGTSRTVRLNRMRQVTARRLTESWQQIPHVLQAVEVDFTRVDTARATGKAAFRARSGGSLTYLPFIARALCLAIRDFPQVNATLAGDDLILHDAVHLGIAVDIDRDGLMVPTIRHAERLTVDGLAAAIMDVSARARAGRLTPSEIGGSTYTLSNSGSFGTLITAPIVNPPEVAILSTDGIRKRPVVVELDGGDVIAIRPIGILAQSFDHRAIDGAYSASFLNRLRQIIETRDWTGDLD